MKNACMTYQATQASALSLTRNLLAGLFVVIADVVIIVIDARNRSQA
jgi:hypothetical protein